MNTAKETRAQLMFILKEVLTEVKSARKKYGPINSAHEGYAVVLEELDEAWDEIKAGNRTLAREEMIQVAASAVNFLLDVKDGIAHTSTKTTSRDTEENGDM